MNKKIRYKVYKSTRGLFTKYVYTVAIFFLLKLTIDDPFPLITVNLVCE